MSVPATLGPYKIGKRLGKGGMGAVYEATNEETGERVAVKTLAAELATGEGFRERFQAEIESLRTLRHPNIVRLYGYGEEAGVHFYSMELVEGVSLEEELRAGRRFDWREVARIAIQVSRALKHAHDHGVIHRDIKPANILLEGERVKLADFGIAQLFGGAKLTTARGVVGTADFMSPEQAASRPITDRCDQYSLGCVMYTLLAGRPPFRAKGLPEMLQLQRYAEAEPVTRFAPDTPKQLERVIMQLLEKSPKDRFPSAMALAKHLEAMSLALSRPKPLDLPETDFQIQNDAEPRASTPAEYAETPPASVRVHDPYYQHETLAPPTRGPSDLSVADTPAVAGAPAGEPERPHRKFTLVGDDPLLTPATARPLWQWAAQVGALALLTAGALAALAWALWPASADALHGKVTAAAAQGDAALLDAEDELHDFLARFPDDPRVEQLQPLLEQLAFAQTERKMLAKLRLSEASDSPAESLYLRAMRLAKDDPEAALHELRGMIALVKASPTDGGPAAGDAEKALLQLAEQQTKRLEKRVEHRAKAQLPFLQSRVDAAAELAASDPEAAAVVCHAVIDLYADREWAAGVVGRARKLLSELGGAQ